MVFTQQTRPFFFKWAIEKYLALAKKDKIISQPFTTGGPIPRKWAMHIYPQGNGTACSGYVSVYLAYLSPDHEVTASRKFSIKSATNNDYSVGPWPAKEYIQYRKENFALTWGYSKFISIQELQERASDLLPNDTLTLICEGEVMLERKHEEVKENAEFYGPGLYEDVQQIMKSNLNRDVTLVSQQTEFPVHQFILCARSPVFAAMFEHDTEEKRSGRVIIKDCKPEVVQDLIHFVYTDQAPEDMQVELAMELLAAADKYQILRLKCLCEIWLTKCLTVGTILDILNLAVIHESSKLKEACLKFVKSNVNEVKESQSWKECTNVNVMRILFDYCVC